MSLTLSLLDLFTYFIPGSIFLYTIIEFLALFRILDIDFSNLTSSPFIFISILLSYILGHVLTALYALVWKPISVKFPWNKKDVEQEALEDFKNDYPSIPVEYVTNDTTLLYALLRERPSPNASLERIFRQFVYMHMTGNLHFAIYILAIKQFTAFILLDYPINLLIIGVMLTVIGFLLRTWSRTRWYYFYYYVFCASIAYGPSLIEVLNNNVPKWKVAPITEIPGGSDHQKDPVIE